MMEFGKYALILFIVGLIFIAGCGSGNNNIGSADKLANCLADKNVKEYGAYWCSNCAKQEKLFGSSYKILKDRGVYTECDPRCVKDSKGELPVACKGVEENSAECTKQGVDGYPTWIFANGDRLAGVRELSVLAEKAGCSL